MTVALPETQLGAWEQMPPDLLELRPEGLADSWEPAAQFASLAPPVGARYLPGFRQPSADNRHVPGIEE